MKHNLFSVLGPYRRLIGLLALLTIIANAASLFVPKIVSRAIDSFSSGSFSADVTVAELLAVAVVVFAFTYLQSVLQAYTGERVARDMRDRLAGKVAGFAAVRLERETPSKLLTNLTSDVDAIKTFVAQAVSIVISSAALIIGASIILFLIDWRLALVVLAILPLIAVIFILVFKRLGPLFAQAQHVVDRLNGMINESILGAALIRVFNSERLENGKFVALNSEAKENGMRILGLFSLVIPAIGIIGNMASLAILALGGRFVIRGGMSLGDFTAFNSYVMILIFPIIMSGVVSQIISRAQASYGRIAEVLNGEDEPDGGTLDIAIRGDVEVRNLTIMYGEKHALKDVSFKAKAGGRTAIIGPTAAGKTQLLSALIGIIRPSEGSVLYDGRPLDEYKRDSIHAQVAFVFQDSVMFNMTLRENIAFSLSSREEDVRRAIETSELADFIDSLPDGLETMASERGTSLSGGQKQRIMLARALSLNPKVLLLDDFTARVDATTEKKILANVARNYPGITIISVTQKIASAEHFDQVILLMEGEMLAQGTHEELSSTSVEYAQILESQKSTHAYE